MDVPEIWCMQQVPRSSEGYIYMLSVQAHVATLPQPTSIKLRLCYHIHSKNENTQLLPTKHQLHTDPA